MWKRRDIVEGQRYQVALCQSSNGDRTYALHLAGRDCRPLGTVFLTEVVPNELLSRGGLTGVAEATRLTTGERFWTDAHGVWLTQQEMDALRNGKGDDEVPWVNGLPAKFPPR